MGYNKGGPQGQKPTKPYGAGRGGQGRGMMGNQMQSNQLKDKIFEMQKDMTTRFKDVAGQQESK